MEFGMLQHPKLFPWLDQHQQVTYFWLWCVSNEFLFIYWISPINNRCLKDGTACIWSTESGRCLLQYQGHKGSVNSMRFHPVKDLVMTASGDQTCHLWQAAISPEQMVDFILKIGVKVSLNNGVISVMKYGFVVFANERIVFRRGSRNVWTRG